jgi:hypothetical protein
MEIGRRSQVLLDGAWDFLFFWEEGREKKKEKDNAETRRTQRSAEKKKAGAGGRDLVALDRKSPPFAKDAKDGAPSSLFVGRR